VDASAGDHIFKYSPGLPGLRQYLPLSVEISTFFIKKRAFSN
jgi:hypothetical protein